MSSPRRFARCEMVRLERPSGGTCLLYVAGSFTERLIGLAWLACPPARGGLLIPRCRSVHTIGMRFAIDLVFMTWPPSRTGLVRVLQLHEELTPGLVARLGPGTQRRRRRVAAAELACGGARVLNLRAGMEVVIAAVSGEEGEVLGVPLQGGDISGDITPSKRKDGDRSG